MKWPIRCLSSAKMQQGVTYMPLPLKLPVSTTGWTPPWLLLPTHPTVCPLPLGSQRPPDCISRCSFIDHTELSNTKLKKTNPLHRLLVYPCVYTPQWVAWIGIKWQHFPHKADLQETRQRKSHRTYSSSKNKEYQKRITYHPRLHRIHRKQQYIYFTEDK